MYLKKHVYWFQTLILWFLNAPHYFKYLKGKKNQAIIYLTFLNNSCIIFIILIYNKNKNKK